MIFDNYPCIFRFHARYAPGLLSPLVCTWIELHPGPATLDECSTCTCRIDPADIDDSPSGPFLDPFTGLPL
jgi:hypothetical protein